MTAGAAQVARAHEETAVVAVVAGQSIREAHVSRRVALIRGGAAPDSLPVAGSPEDRRLRRWVVQTMVTELLVEQEARSAGFPGGREPSRPLVAEVVVAVFERVTGHVEVSDAEVARFYAANRGRYVRAESRSVRQVVVREAQAAQRLAARARAEGIASAVRSVSVPGVDLEIEPAVFRRGSVGGALEEHVFAAEIGAVVGPVRSGAGWHVVEVTAASPERVVPLRAVAGGIRADLLAAARGAAFDAWLAAARRRKVRLLPGHEHPGDPAVPDAVHRH